MVGLNIASAVLLHRFVEPAEAAAQQHTVIAPDKIAVSQTFFDEVNHALRNNANFFTPAERAVPPEVYSAETRRIAARNGRSTLTIETILRQNLHGVGLEAFVLSDKPDGIPLPKTVKGRLQLSHVGEDDLVF